LKLLGEFIMTVSPSIALRAVLAVSAFLVAVPLPAQTFPSKPIRIIGIATAGSPSDVTGRAVADVLMRQMGAQFVVENRPGAGGTIAATAVARSDADGHTLLLTTSAQTGMPYLYPNLGYDPIRDFAGVSTLVELPNIMVVPLQRNWDSVKDLIAAAKAKPGSLNFGSGGTGSGTHMNSEKFLLAAGIAATHVPFKGTSEGVVEVIGGRLDWFFSPAAAVVPLVKDGRLKALVVSAKRRMPQLPELPTTAEAGVADAEYQFWIGLLAPRKTPRSAVSRLNSELQKALNTPELRERFHMLGAQTLYMKPEDFDAFLLADTEATGRIVKAANIKPQ
jgi:tripartite-type tricarboxylate transporter receptor subunit TctC